MEKKLVYHRNWIGHEKNESLMYHEDDVFDRETYCRKLHLITEPLVSECRKCQCYEGVMQGKGHECVWEDVTEEQYDVPHKDRYQEYERVDKLIKMGMLKRLVCYDANDWIYEESPDGRNRFLLGKRGQKTLICCGLNPSIATPEKLDPTMKKVETIAKANGYDSYIMINLYPMRSTDPDGMHDEMNEQIVQINLEFIESILKSGASNIWAAWSNLIEKRTYLKNCLEGIVNLAGTYNCAWYNCGETTKEGHPRHPLYLGGGSKLKEFDIAEYCKNIKQ